MRLIIKRLGAMAIDVILLFLVLAPLGGFALWLTEYRPETGSAVYATLLLNFSAPTWAYFIIGDGSGQTVGKRVLGIRVTPLGPPAAVARTAVKLLAWELTHIGMFAFARLPGEPGTAGWTAVVAAYALLAVTLLIAVVTGGGRSLHDLVAGSRVEGA